MKITCQACQSKYTIADDKIQGKVAKIRCRKCGATVLVDASAGSANGSSSSMAPAAPADTWLVSVAEGDQRSMRLDELIAAYNGSVVTAETYVWKDGMTDWVPLAEAPEIVDALNRGAAPKAADPEPQPVAAPAKGPSAYGASPAVAARRETNRGRSGDLFGGAPSEEEVATSAPAQAARQGGGGGGGAAVEAAGSGGLTGARDEHSVLFSLSALTGGKATSPGAPAPTVPLSPSSGSSRNTEDSGLIDLNALAAAQATKPVEAAPQLLAPSPFLFPAALGTVEAPELPQAQRKSSMPLIVGGGIAVAGIAIAVALMATKKSDEPMPAAAPSASVAPVVTQEPAPAAPTETAAASASAAAEAKAGAPKKGGGGGARTAPGPKATPAAQAAPAPAAPAPAKKSPCGCAPGDLQCQIRCSATGH